MDVKSVYLGRLFCSVPFELKGLVISPLFKEGIPMLAIDLCGDLAGRTPKKCRKFIGLNKLFGSKSKAKRKRESLTQRIILRLRVVKENQ